MSLSDVEAPTSGEPQSAVAECRFALLLNKIILAGGVRHFRRAAETPFNLIFEARA